jgi:predicted RNA-binding protein with PIN domain
VDELNRNWQRLVLTHLEEKEHVGVLTGSAITDIKITLVAGRAHQKHTEGGDFRQATYRALRQGLRQAESVLLEPWYDFCVTLPEEMIGRAMTDMELRHGIVKTPQREGNEMVLEGSAPVACLKNYQKELTAYTKGKGRILCSPGGYRPCHNTEEVVARIGYDPDADLANPCSSVFCAHGAGFVVEWNQVPEFMHVESVLAPARVGEGTVAEPFQAENNYDGSGEVWLGTDEIDAILERTYHANRRTDGVRGKNTWKLSGKRQISYEAGSTGAYKPTPQAEEYLLVDGYNIIFAWDELKELAAANVDGARGRLLDIMCNYQGIRKCQLIVVFDAYRVQGHQTEFFDYHNIHVVYTKEAETADQYIEKFAHENGKKYRVTVATSDGLEQVIIRGAGCMLLSARDLQEEVKRQHTTALEAFEEQKEKGKTYLFDTVSKETIRQIQGEKDGCREAEEKSGGNHEQR